MQCTLHPAFLASRAYVRCPHGCPDMSFDYTQVVILKGALALPEDTAFQNDEAKPYRA